VASIPFKETLYLWEQTLLASWGGVLFSQEMQDIDIGCQPIVKPLLLLFIAEHTKKESYHWPALSLSQRASTLNESVFFVEAYMTQLLLYFGVYMEHLLSDLEDGFSNYLLHVSSMM
jgi:hypothetical protein